MIRTKWKVGYVVYGFDDDVYGDIPDFSLDPDYNEKVEERRQQRQNEIDHEIGSEQNRLLANYLHKLEDKQKWKRLTIACYSY